MQKKKQKKNNSGEVWSFIVIVLFIMQHFYSVHVPVWGNGSHKLEFEFNVLIETGIIVMKCDQAVTLNCPFYKTRSYIILPGCCSALEVRAL